MQQTFFGGIRMTASRFACILAAIASVFACLPIAAAYDNTQWQGEPGTTKDWFDPANWTNGVPDEQTNDARIDNAGIARINGGSAVAPFLSIANNLSGGLILDAGTLDTKYDIYLGDSKDSHGSLDVNGGTLTTQALQAGVFFGSGTVSQTNGLVHAYFIELGGSGNFGATQYGNPEDFGNGSYHLTGGSLESTQVRVGNSGVGTFRQDGGNVAIEAVLKVGGAVGAQSPPDWMNATLFPDSTPVLVTNHAIVQPGMAIDSSSAINDVFIPPPTPSVGRYDLAAGSLTSRELQIDHTGAVHQTGGSNHAQFVNIADGGHYELLGGTLQIALGLNNDGIFDFGHSNATLISDGAILDFSHGLRGTEHAHIQAGPDSLTIFAPGFHPRRDLGSYQTQGLTHIAGSDLVLRPGQGFGGVGAIEDHVIAAGSIHANDPTDLGGINLNGGLEIMPGAHVDLGEAGGVFVKDKRTAIRGGNLKAGSLNVTGTIHYQPATVTPGPNGTVINLHLPTVDPGLARQTGGSVDLRTLFVEAGRYVLNGGDLKTRDISIYGNYSFSPPLASASFVQNGGSVSAQVVYIASVLAPITLDAQLIQPNSISVTDSAGPFRRSNGTPPTTRPSNQSYEMRGGSLSVDTLEITTSFAANRPQFHQSRGDVNIKRVAEISGATASYTISGGSLRARRFEFGSAYDFYVQHDGGTFSIMNPTAKVTIAGELLLGNGGHFSAVPGATIHFTHVEPLDDWVPLSGDTFSIHSTNSEEVGGLGNLTAIFDGGLDSTATLEAAGKDLGPGPAGFLHNFALKTLQVGGTDSAKLSLVDLVDNELNGDGNEAVYVDNLIVRPGSVLDLAGIHLYYHTADIAAGAVVSGSILAVAAIPEPGTAAFACVAILGSIFASRRQRRS
jgi:hypothetical protein